MAITPSASNAKPSDYQIEVEANDLGVRVAVNGRITIPLPQGVWPSQSEIYATDTGALWRVVEEPLGTQVAVLVSQPLSNSFVVLPPPRVRSFPVSFAIGKDAANTDRGCYGLLRVSLADVPPSLLADTSARLQLELVRYTPKRNRRSFDGVSQVRRPMPNGFYHPTNWVGGVSPAAVGGTRGGSQGTVVDRPSEWPLTGASPNSVVDLHIASVMLPWFVERSITDRSGNTQQALVYCGANKRTRRQNVKGYTMQPMRGVFAFRYAMIDPATGLFVSGPISELVFVRPQKWPIEPTGLYPGTGVVYPPLPATPLVDPNTGVSQYLQLTASVGGRITRQGYPT